MFLLELRVTLIFTRTRPWMPAFFLVLSEKFLPFTLIFHSDPDLLTILIIEDLLNNFFFFFFFPSSQGSGRCGQKPKNRVKPDPQPLLYVKNFLLRSQPQIRKNK